MGETIFEHYIHKTILMLQKIFGFHKETMSIKKEVIGGITTFLTMAYILAVNPDILGDAGMDKGAVFTATVVSSVIATLVMAVYAKLPFALAPGMGLNAFFAYTIVLTMGYTWQFALTAVLLEGIIFIVLTLTGLRQRLVDAMPLPLQHAISPGIGIFIAFIGLKNANLIVTSPATLLSLGNLHSPGVMLACIGIILSAILLIRNVTGALLIGILVTTLIGIPMGVTHFGDIVSTPPTLSPIFCQFEWSGIFTADMVICVVTLLFFDIFDTIGTLIGVCNRAGMVDKEGNVPELNKAFMADALGTTFGAMLGTSTVSTYVESASGVNVGGRSGLTSFVAAICFAIALFMAPLFLSIPSEATAPALVLVGVMMMCDVSHIDFTNYLVAIPCFIIMLIMTFTSSISDGIMLGMIAYVLLHLLSGHRKEVNISSLILGILFVLKFIFL